MTHMPAQRRAEDANGGVEAKKGELQRMDRHTQTGAGSETPRDGARSVEVFGRRLPMPRSRLLRIVLGVLLVIGGIFGFLPILGFWMVPLGLLVLSYEFASIRRFRRRTAVWWGRRGEKSSKNEA